MLLSTMGAPAQAGLLVAALTLVRAPQSLLSPAIGNLLPHLSRLHAHGDGQGTVRFVRNALGAVGLVGVGLVGGTWLLGELAMRIVYGTEVEVGQGLLTVLASLAALYLLSEVLNQVLFARGLGWAAAACWALGLALALGFVLLSGMDLLERVAYGLAVGSLSTVVAQGGYLAAVSRRNRRTPTG